MVEVNWQKERVLVTPITLYMEYINLKYGAFLKEKFEDLDLNHGDLTYLVNIFYHENLSQRKLADLLFVSEAYVTKVLKRLEDNDYIIRVKDSSNKSRKIIHLTEKGKLIVTSVIKVTFEFEKSIMDSFGDDDVGNLKGMLFELSKNAADF